MFLGDKNKTLEHLLQIPCKHILKHLIWRNDFSKAKRTKAKKTKKTKQNKQTLVCRFCRGLGHLFFIYLFCRTGGPFNWSAKWYENQFKPKPRPVKIS